MNRRIYKILNKDGKAMAFCWASSQEEAKDLFGENFAPPIETIDATWKTKTYFKLFEGEINAEEYRGYKYEDKGSGGVITFENELFNDSKIFQNVTFQPNSACFVSLIRLYKSGDDCPKEGNWGGVNDDMKTNDSYHYLDDGFSDIEGKRSVYHYLGEK